LVTFQFYARKATGEPVKGFLEATSKEEALSKLRNQKLFIISIQEQKTKNIKAKLLGPGKLPVKDLAVFCRQLATMLSAGLPLLNSLVVLSQQVENKRLGSIVDKVALTVQEGGSLGSAFRQHKEIPELMISMIDVGELGGVLDEVLARLASHLEKEYIMTEKVKAAMTYPVVVLGVAILAIIALLLFVVPSFKQMLADLGVELPLLTRLLLTISDWTAKFWYLLVLLLIAIVLALRYFFQTAKGRKLLDQAILNIPIFGILNQKVIISRLTRTLGTLLKGGVPILTALEVVKKAVNNVIVAKALDQAQDSIRNGSRMAGPLAKNKFFPPMVVQMIAIGEETGSLDSMLEKISDFYDSDVDNMVSKLASLLEPVMILVLGSIIGIIILAVMLPMFSVIGSM
jgi:type IV pilus assembly protein PilC